MTLMSEVIRYKAERKEGGDGQPFSLRQSHDDLFEPVDASSRQILLDETDSCLIAFESHSL